MPDLFDHGPARAFVQMDWGLRLGGVAIWLAEKRWLDGAPVLTVAQPAELTFAAAGDEAVRIDQPPTLRLTDDMGRSLLDALVQHYGGHSNLLSLRRDYDAERARVDKMTAALITLATGGRS